MQNQRKSNDLFFYSFVFFLQRFFKLFKTVKLEIILRTLVILTTIHMMAVIILIILISVLIPKHIQSQYIFSSYGQSNRMNWDESNQWCNDQGLQLVSIHSESEWNQIRQAIADNEALSLVVDPGQMYNYNIGLKRNGDQSPFATPAYSWTDGTLFNYGNDFASPPWVKNEPNIVVGQYSVVCHRLQSNNQDADEHLRWDDVECSSTTNGVKGRAICFEPELDTTVTPSVSPSKLPSRSPSETPSTSPSEMPSNSPSELPSATLNSTISPTDSTSSPSTSTMSSADVLNSGVISNSDQPSFPPTTPTEKEEGPAKVGMDQNLTLLIVVIVCAVLSICFCIAGAYLLKKARKIPVEKAIIISSKTSQIGLTDNVNGNENEIPPHINMVKCAPSDEALLSAPSSLDNDYKDSMDEGDGGSSVPLTAVEKKNLYEKHDIETGALDTWEDGDSSDDGSYKRELEKKSTVGAVDDKLAANIGRDEFVIDEDEDEDDIIDDSRKITDGYDDDEQHDGIISDVDGENEDIRFVIEGGIDENQPLHENFENYQEEIRTADDNVGSDEFIVVGDDEQTDDIDILTRDDNNMTNHGY